MILGLGCLSFFVFWPLFLFLYYFNFTNVTSSHPIALRLTSGSTSTVPGTTGNNASSGVYGNGTTPTLVTYQVPFDAPAIIYYQCVFHSGMIGAINIVDQTGYTGSKGDTGNTGAQGNVGFTGSKGDQGIPGEFAALGYTGSQGVGFTGSQGVTGFVGSKGDIGFTGSTGYTGSLGFTGSVGYAGSKGDIGYTGSKAIIQSDTAPIDTTVLWLDKNASGVVSTDTLSPFLLMGG